MKKLRIALPLLFVFPFVVGFAPPDTDGTFIGLAGGKGVYPTASCGQGFRNEYKEVAVKVDHRFETRDAHSITPDYLTVGVFGEQGSRQRTVTYYDEDDGGYVSPATGVRSSEIQMLGGHVALDWRFAGIDFGAMSLKASLGDDSSMRRNIVPRLGVRLGVPQFYVSASILEGTPLLSDASMVNIGGGTQFRNAQFWAGLGGQVVTGETLAGIFRMRYNFKPVALDLTLQRGGGDYNTPNYGVALGVDIRLP